MESKMKDYEEEEFTFVIENKNNYKSKAILFAGAVFPTLKQEDGVSVCVKEYLHDQLRMHSVFMPYYMEGFKYEVIGNDVSQFENEMTFYLITAWGDGSWKTVYPINYAENNTINNGTIELPTYSFPITGNHYIEVELNPNIKIVITFKKKARIDCTN